MSKIALDVDHVSMRFNLSTEKVDNIKEYIIKMIKNELMFQEFWALRDVSFRVKRGDRVGILGMNGAGKSTLLKIIAGVMKPSEGEVNVRGKIAPLLELGAGFDKQYTGAENIYLYGAMLGYSKEFIEEKYKDIVKFSELGDFIHVPLKNYSSGMKARLGFSVATVVEPEILILDEVLSVGDARFRRKCERRLKGMFDKGVTVLFVSHSTQQVLRMCNRGILLEDGQLIAEGSAKDVVSFYEAKLTEAEEE
ncbi:MAG: ABC transporter ATP-binding protein [Eubacterium sp.]|nr:ABC transporter ATP-binding protein [Eubacterium sp.]